MPNVIGYLGLVVFGIVIVVALTNMTIGAGYKAPPPSEPIIGVPGGISGLFLDKSAQAGQTSGQQNTQPAQQAQNGPVRTVKLGYKNYGFYFPESGSDTINLKLGQPVKLEGILEGSDKLVGCMKSVRTPWGLKVFKPSDTTFEFTPDKTGLISFTCGMGMGVGQFNILN